MLIVMAVFAAFSHANEANSNPPSIKLIASFEDKNSFGAGTIVEEHATDGKKALRIDKSYASMEGAQNWLGYDYLKVDVFTDAKSMMKVFVEIRDGQTKDYWTRVNYESVVPPGQSTLILPIKRLYVGEKSRPGRNLNMSAITRLVFGIGDAPEAPLFMDNVRLERDDAGRSVMFDGLRAFNLCKDANTAFEGFTSITPNTPYTKERGYGLKNATIWRAVDALQPEPLYGNFICIEAGGLAVDLPNGKYRVFVNIDSPSGYWGEYPYYRSRSILAQGKPVVTDNMDFESLKRKYFRFWNVEDLPADNTFDKYQKTYFQEKAFDVEVTGGQLYLEFKGRNWACSVSAVILYPADKAVEGEKFLKYVENKRRFYFDNYFKRMLHPPSGEPLQPSDEDKKRGYVVFQRDLMKEVYYNDTPLKDEIGRPITGAAFAGECESIAPALVPLQDLGNVTVAVSDLVGPGTIKANAIDVGFVSYRVSRVTMEGSVYTIRPRLVMPRNSVACPMEVARRFWVTVKTPTDANPGLYKGKLHIKPEKGAAAEMPFEFLVRSGTLDPVDVPAGPWGYSIGVPWYGDDPAAAAYAKDISLKSLRKLRDYGFTMFSGIPTIAFNGFKDGKPMLDFSQADPQMKTAKELGFLAVNTYGSGVSGLNMYAKDTAKMTAAGFKDYSEFIKAIFSEIQKHADETGWIPVYYNLCDESSNPSVLENSKAYRTAFPKGPPCFSGALSFQGKDQTNPAFQVSENLHVPAWNLHNEDSVNLLHQVGGDWAFYNGGNRWTYGDYMYKAVKQFNMKFRISWHWNICAGDPYYALDCREDDYAWCNSTPDGELVPSLDFERIRSGLNDYRRMLTLARLAKEKAGTAAAQAGEKPIQERMTAFKLGQRDHDALFGPEDWKQFRAKLDAAIEELRK